MNGEMEWPTEAAWSQMRPAERWKLALQLLHRAVRQETRVPLERGKPVPFSRNVSRALELADQALEERR